MADDRRWRRAPLFSALAIVALAGVTGLVFDAGRAVLVLATGALLAVITVLWASVRTFAGDAPFTVDEALALGAPSTTEEQKRAVLQALKDLEYERSVGKVGDDDYHELLARYRAEAKRLLRAADEELGPLRAKAEAFVASQKGGGAKPGGARAKPGAPSEDEIGDGSASGSATGSLAGESPAATQACPSCATINDHDAIFCKKCGASLRATVTKPGHLEPPAGTAGGSPKEEP